jgi:hypothetical protein
VRFGRHVPHAPGEADEKSHLPTQQMSNTATTGIGEHASPTGCPQPASAPRRTSIKRSREWESAPPKPAPALASGAKDMDEHFNVGVATHFMPSLLHEAKISIL